MKLDKVSGIKVVGWSLVVMAIAGLFIVVNSLGVHAMKVRTEVQSMPAGIARIIDKHGKPPKGLFHPKGGWTALTINTDVLFGNVFPGEIRQGEFIVKLTDTDPSPDGFNGLFTRVEYHLIVAGKAGNLDLSPYLTIVRDTTETDIESDTVGSASLDSSQDPSDIEDRWIVTLTLPNDPPKGDYWTTITVCVDSTVPPGPP